MPLHAHIHVLVFIVPSVLDCGGCLAGDSKSWSIKCVNFGGEGSFKIMETGSMEDGSVTPVCVYVCHT